MGKTPQMDLGVCVVSDARGPLPGSCGSHWGPEPPALRGGVRALHTWVGGALAPQAKAGAAERVELAGERGLQRAAPRAEGRVGEVTGWRRGPPARLAISGTECKGEAGPGKARLGRAFLGRATPASLPRGSPGSTPASSICPAFPASPGARPSAAAPRLLQAREERVVALEGGGSAAGEVERRGREGQTPPS